MKIGIAGPVQCQELAPHLGNVDTLPVGLGGTAVTALVHGLLRSGNEVGVYTLDPSLTRSFHRRGERLSLYIGPYRPRARDRATDLFRAEREAIAGFVAADAPDVVNAHWTYEFGLGALSVRSDTVVTVRDWAPRVLRLQPDPYRFVRALMNRECLRRTTHATCPSPYIAAQLRGRGIVAAVTPNMVSDVAYRAPVRESRRARTAVCVSQGFGGWKNIESVIRARALIGDVTLVLVGADLGPGGRAESWALANGLNTGVEYRGRLDHAAAVAEIGNADLLVCPSLEESFGNVLVEAMAQGVPVIGGLDSGAVPWVLDGGEAGVLVDVRDPSAIAAAVDVLLRDDGLWRQYSRSGRSSVEERFSEAGVMKVYERIYREVLGG